MSGRRAMYSGGVHVCIPWLLSIWTSFLQLGNHGWWVLMGANKHQTCILSFPGSLVRANPMLLPGTLALEGELRNCSYDSSRQAVSCEDSSVPWIWLFWGVWVWRLVLLFSLHSSLVSNAISFLRTPFLFNQVNIQDQGQNSLVAVIWLLSTI